MVYLLLAVVSSALISIVMRMSTGKVQNKVSMLAVNYVVCMVMGACFTGFGNLFPEDPKMPATIGMGVINGFLYLSGFVLLQWNVRKNGVVLPTLFGKLGLLVPMILSIFLFGEMPSVLQGLGFVVAIAAVVLINYEKKSVNNGFKAGLLILLLANGSCDAMAKMYEQYGSSNLSEHFVLYTFAVALVLCVALMLLRKEKPGKSELMYGAIIGVPNFFAARFLLMAVENLPAVIVYPTFSVGTILLVTLTGVLFFKERLNKRQWIGAAAILTALILLNI